MIFISYSNAMLSDRTLICIQFIIIFYLFLSLIVKDSSSSSEISVRRLSASATCRRSSRLNYLDLSRCYHSTRGPIRWSEYPRRLNPNDSRRVLSAPDEFVIQVEDDHGIDNSSYVDMEDSSHFRCNSPYNNTNTDFVIPDTDRLVRGVATKSSTDSGIDCDVNIQFNNEHKRVSSEQSLNSLSSVAYNSCLKTSYKNTDLRYSYGDECRLKLQQLMMKSKMKKYYSHSAGMRESIINSSSNTTEKTEESLSTAGESVYKRLPSDVPKTAPAHRSEIRLPKKLNDSFFESQNNLISLPSPSELIFPTIPDTEHPLLRHAVAPSSKLINKLQDKSNSSNDSQSTNSSLHKANSIRSKSSMVFSPKLENPFGKRLSFKRPKITEAKSSEKGFNSSEKVKNHNSSINFSLSSLVAVTSKIFNTSNSNHNEQVSRNNIKSNKDCGKYKSAGNLCLTRDGYSTPGEDIEMCSKPNNNDLVSGMILKTNYQPQIPA